MSLWGILGKKVLAESAKNHFGQEVSCLMSFELLKLLGILLIQLKLGSLFRASPGLALEPRLGKEDTKATKGHPTGVVRE